MLPGSKATASDLAWLRAQGLDAAITTHARAGGRVLGICGGLQMLGAELRDPHGVESGGPGGDSGNSSSIPGLGLLPLATTFAPRKTVRRVCCRFGAVSGPWAALSGVQASGYEIHCGQTAPHPALAARGETARELMAGMAWQNAAGNVLGVYLHGLFEDPAVLRALFGARARPLDEVFERLAAVAADSFAPGFLQELIQEP